MPRFETGCTIAQVIAKRHVGAVFALVDDEVVHWCTERHVEHIGCNRRGIFSGGMGIE